MRNSTVLPRLLAAIAALGVIACTFVFPYIVSTGSDTGKAVDLVVETVGDLPVKVVPEMTVKDMKSMTLFRFVRINFAIMLDEASKGGEPGESAAAFIYMALFMIPALCAAACFFTAIGDRPVLTILLSLLNGWMTVKVFLWMGRYNIPNYLMKWGASRWLIFAFAALLTVSAIAMLVGKIKMKRAKRHR